MTFAGEERSNGVVPEQAPGVQKKEGLTFGHVTSQRLICVALISRCGHGAREEGLRLRW